VNIKTTLKSSVAVAALFAVAAPVANADIKNGNKNSLTISGQVVRAIYHADDGASDKTFQSGGRWTASRVRWIARGKVNENVGAGATIEMNIPISQVAGSQTLGSPGGVDGAQGTSSAWAIRHQFVWVNHKKFGKLSMGNTDPASNGSSEADFSGAGMFSGSDGGGAHGSGIAFMNSTIASAPTASGVTIVASINNLDGISRTDVIRYDTPRFQGLQLKFGAIAGGAWDMGANYSAKFGPVRVRARAGYADTSATSASTNYTLSGSVALLHDSGLLGTFAIGKRNFAGGASKASTDFNLGPGAGANLGTDTNFNGVEDPHFWYFGVGYNAKIFSPGGTAFYVKFNRTEDLAQVANNDDSEADSIGVAVVQRFSSIGAQIGVEYKNYSYESKSNATDNTFDDIDVITLQTIFAF
jgi:predicted porin